jgi:hypothetical protein
MYAISDSNWSSETIAKLYTVRTAPAVAGYGTALAVVLGTWQYAGGKITGYAIDPTVDEVARKEYVRKNRRRPMEETLEQIGEGRGMDITPWPFENVHW